MAAFFYMGARISSANGIDFGKVAGCPARLYTIESDRLEHASPITAGIRD